MWSCLDFNLRENWSIALILWHSILNLVLTCGLRTSLPAGIALHGHPLIDPINYLNTSRFQSKMSHYFGGSDKIQVIKVWKSEFLLHFLLFCCLDSGYKCTLIRAHTVLAMQCMPCWPWNTNYEIWENLCLVVLWEILWEHIPTI